MWHYITTLGKVDAIYIVHIYLRGLVLETSFIGRAMELRALKRRLQWIEDRGEGRSVVIRGRRQVGKSRLVQEFCNSADTPYVFWTATKGSAPAVAIRDFWNALKVSTLAPDPHVLPEVSPGNWPDAFRMLAASLPDRPSIVVIDEIPWLSEQDGIFEGALQTAWDRLLRDRPILLLLLGSDLHMMEQFSGYDRPFYGRADPMVLRPLNPAEVGHALHLDGIDAIDAHLVSGGVPGIVRDWQDATPALTFLEGVCDEPASPVFTIPDYTLTSEFPAPDHTRRVLDAIGHGDRTHANIAAAVGGMQGALPSGILTPILNRLVTEKRVVALEEPLSTRPGRAKLYRIADSNLRLYMGILRQAQEEASRGRSKSAFELIKARWTTWRGRAVEPLVREAMENALLDGDLPGGGDGGVVGGWWNREFNPEIDIVGADRSPAARQIFFTGSIKWLGTPFDNHDLAALRAASPYVPGYDEGSTKTVVVSRSGVADSVDQSGIDVLWGPDDVLRTWRLL